DAAGKVVAVASLSTSGCEVYSDADALQPLLEVTKTTGFFQLPWYEVRDLQSGEIVGRLGPPTNRGFTLFGIPFSRPEGCTIYEGTEQVPVAHLATDDNDLDGCAIYEGQSI